MEASQASPSPISFRFRAETVLILIIAVLFGALLAWRSRHFVVSQSAEKANEAVWMLELRDVPRRDVPLNVQPTGAYRDFISEEELAPIVAELVPYLPGPQVGVFLHSLRLWGPDATFEEVWDVPSVSGLRMYPGRLQLDSLIDNEVFQRVFEKNFAIPQLLGEGPVGVTVLTNTDGEIGAYQGQYHIDKLLQVLGEINIPASHPVVPRFSSPERSYYKVDDVLQESLWSYSPFQEPEFTVSAYSRWLKAPAVWRNRFGEESSLESLVDRLIDRPDGNGACLGIHVCYALASVLRASEVEPIISMEARDRVRDRLREISIGLVRNQREDGAWSKNWHGPFVRTAENWVYYFEVPPYCEVLATGHHLEWIAIAPPDVCPPPDAVQRAVNYLKTTLSHMEKPFFTDIDVYPLGTHAVRALCLIRGVEPSTIYQQYPIVPYSLRSRTSP